MANTRAAVRHTRQRHSQPSAAAFLELLTAKARNMIGRLSATWPNPSAKISPGFHDRTGCPAPRQHSTRLPATEDS